MSRYQPLLPATAQDAERELEEAFESDEEEDARSAHELSPLTSNTAYNGRAPLAPANAPSVRHERARSITIPGAYDFEREYEYDYPPPGSPPRPSANALPNDFGNSNGVLPSSPVRPSAPRVSFFRRVAGAVLPTHYVRVPTEAGASRAVGGGTENDGVFANVMAKPQRPRIVQTDGGDPHVVPEDIQKDVPPSYAEAQADAVPPYWETTVHAPLSTDPSADMIIDDLPTGSFLVFCLNAFISFFFQFVGFLLTYLLHTTHAAKYGARAGLGLTLIQFGFYSRTDGTSGDPGAEDPVASGGLWSPGGNITAVPSPTSAPTPDDNMFSVTAKDWLSFLFMTLGWFLVLSSLIGFWRVKRWEKVLRTPTVPPTPEEIEHDRVIRRNIQHVFGIAFGDDEEEERARRPITSAEAEARLARDLRAAGLI